MLKAVSSITNAIGALNFKGTWDANANSPALASSVGTKGDYYVVGTAGATNLNGISNWGVGDLATFNGSVWQRVEGGADLNGVNLSVSGTSTLSGLTASTALALNASKEVVSVTNTGTGNNVLATSPSIATPTITGDATMSDGNLQFSGAAKGIRGSSSFSVALGNGASGTILDLATALPSGASGFVTVAGASAGKATILCQRDQGGYYSVTELGTQPRGTYITSISLSGTNLQITNSTGGPETFVGRIVVLI
jgi:hypothetical protein